MRKEEKDCQEKKVLLLPEVSLGRKNATYPLKGLVLNRVMETEFSKETRNMKDLGIRLQTEVKR